MICATTDTLKVRKVASGEVVTLSDRVGSESFSPDGQKLAIAIYDEEGDKHSIWLYTIGEWQTPKLLLSYTSIFRPGLIWSPDSQSIAIPYLEEGVALSNLYLDGTHKNLLTYDDVQYDYAPGGRFNMSWSPDGKKILYTTYTENDPLQSLSQAIRLRVVDVVTGQKELLFSGKPGEAAFFPIWSPNGSLITFQPSRLEKYMRVYFYDLENKTLTGIGDFPNGYSAAWSPDSKHLAVCSTWLYIITVATGQIDDLGETCSSFLSWQGNSRVIVQQNYVLYAISIP
jgi:WD40 repeat protein